jgi:hypothetical protein
MMNDEDIKEFHNIGQKPGLKKSNKYNYMQGKQITDPRYWKTSLRDK